MSSSINTSNDETSQESTQNVGDPAVTYRSGEIVFTVLLLIVALVMCWQAYRISGFEALSSPGAFPMATAAIMVAGLLVLLVKGLVQRKLAAAQMQACSSAATRQAIAPAIVVIFVGCVLGFATLLDVLGFLPAALLFLLVTIKYLNRGSLLFTMIVSLGSLILIYVVFRLVFSVVLPEGVVPESAIMAWIESLFTGTGAAQ